METKGDTLDSRRNDLHVIATKCFSAASKHVKQSEHYKLWYRVLSIPTIVFTQGAAVLSTYEIGLSSSEASAWGYFAIVLTILNAILIGILNFLEPGKVAVAHENAARSFIHLGQSIEFFILKDRSEELWNEFTSQFKTNYLEMSEKAPMILYWSRSKSVASTSA